jgi:molybdopterin-synthase adenylyltransferase
VPLDRYQRQILLPQILSAGQMRLSQARVMLVGVGALGCTVADQLTRAGVGQLTLIDRDIVDVTNLHRQTLFNESDVIGGVAKVSAAARYLHSINTDVQIDAVAGDVDAVSIMRLLHAHQPDVLIDATDNVATRYLLNDVAVRENLPLVYGACVGVEGRVMGIIPGHTPCLRCVFAHPPSPGEVPTCDTAGVLGPLAATVGAMQAIEAMRIIVDPQAAAVSPALITIDAWKRRYHTIDLTGQRDATCVCCVQRRFDFLNTRAASAVTLCGRNTVQIRLHTADIPDGKLSGETFLDSVEQHLRASTTDVVRNAFLIRCRVDETIEMTVFRDARVMIHGTSDAARARLIVARCLG